MAEPKEINQRIVGTLAVVLVEHFTQLLNASLDEGRLPAGWLTSKIILVYKGVTKDDCDGYGR